MLSTIVQAGLVAVDGITFGERMACPVCGGPVSGYDTRKKVFALVRENGRERAIRVTVKRFSCRRCDRIVNADEPFYPGTRIGSPVIDLCLTLATTMPVNRTAAWLDAMDVIVNRTSCRLVREGPCPVGTGDCPVWHQDADVGDLTFHPCRRGRTRQSRQRGRSSRSLWFPIRRPGSASPVSCEGPGRAGYRGREKRTARGGSRARP